MVKFSVYLNRRVFVMECFCLVFTAVLRRADLVQDLVDQDSEIPAVDLEVAALEVHPVEGMIVLVSFAFKLSSKQAYSNILKILPPKNTVIFK